VRRFCLLVALGFAALVVGCASLPPSKPIQGAASLAGTWRGRMSGPLGNAPLILTIQGDGAYQGVLYVEPTYREVRGVISVVRPGFARYEGNDGNGRVILHENEGRRVLRLVGDGGGRTAELTPTK
jgi:hypothetical protein